MMTQLVLRIPAVQKTILEIEAEKLGTTVGALVRDAIDSFLQKTQKKTAFSQMLKVAERTEKYVVPNAPKDLSTKYKQYLYGKDKK